MNMIFIQIKIINIDLLCQLYKKLFSENNKYSNRTLEILSIIYKENECNALLIAIFVTFLNNDE